MGNTPFSVQVDDYTVSLPRCREHIVVKSDSLTSQKFMNCPIDTG